MILQTDNAFHYKNLFQNWFSIPKIVLNHLKSEIIHLQATINLKLQLIETLMNFEMLIKLKDRNNNYILSLLLRTLSLHPFRKNVGMNQDVIQRIIWLMILTVLLEWKLMKKGLIVIVESIICIHHVCILLQWNFWLKEEYKIQQLWPRSTIVLKENQEEVMVSQGHWLEMIMISLLKRESRRLQLSRFPKSLDQRIENDYLI